MSWAFPWGPKVSGFPEVCNIILDMIHIIYTLQGINISHLGKRKIIFKMPFLGDMLVPSRVYIHTILYTYIKTHHMFVVSRVVLLQKWIFQASWLFGEYMTSRDVCKTFAMRLYMELLGTLAMVNVMGFGEGRRTSMS